MRTVLIVGMMLAMGMPAEAEPLVDPPTGDPIEEVVDCVQQLVERSAAGCDLPFVCITGGGWVAVNPFTFANPAELVKLAGSGVPVRAEPLAGGGAYLLTVVVSAGEACFSNEPPDGGDGQDTAADGYCTWALGPGTEFEPGCFIEWYTQHPPQE